jgi:hypothetical protein
MKKIKLSEQIKNDWSKYGDLSNWVREELIRKVKKLEKYALSVKGVKA